MINIRISPRQRLWLVSVGSGLCLTACSNLSPDYTRPELSVSQAWLPTSSQTVSQSAEQPLLRFSDEQLAGPLDIAWQQFIVDPRLASLIELALNNNRDLRATLASVEAARASYLAKNASLYPSIDGSLSGNRSKSASGSISTVYQAQAGLSAYELDLFGKNSQGSEAQRQAYLASGEAAKAAQIALIGEIATAWLTLASDHALLQLARETADNAAKNVTITQKRLSMGVDSRIDVVSAETTYHNATSDIASYSTLVMQDRNALRLLLGDNPADNLLALELPDSAQLVSDIPPGIPSSVLLQRPDVLAAEHSLQSSNASIGVARSAFFPSFTLTATAG